MAPLRVERAPGGSRLGVTRAQRPTALCLPPLLLLLLLLLGAVSASPESLNQSLPESQNQSHPTEDSLVSKGKMEDYETHVLPCWYEYKSCMDSVKDWCNWTLISRQQQIGDKNRSHPTAAPPERSPEPFCCAVSPDMLRRRPEAPCRFRVFWATTMAMSFEWPWQYRFPPFFTLQPNVDTRQKQLAAWCSLVLSFCRLHKQSSMTVMEAQESPLFNNVKLQRKLPVESIQIVLEELRKKGNLEWLDKNKSSFLIMWRRPEEWGKLIYQWVSRSGQNNSVFTLYELTSGEDTEDEEFHGLDEATLLRALQALQQEHKAEIITVSDGRGVKFF